MHVRAEYDAHEQIVPDDDGVAVYFLLGACWQGRGGGRKEPRLGSTDYDLVRHDKAG
jgi:hypothetical protein